MNIKTPIIPLNQTFVKTNEKHEINLKAICVFSAIGFFLDQDSYWKDEIVLSPATLYKLNSKTNTILSADKWFNWHYSPRNISFKQAFEEYGYLFESVIKEKTKEKKTILPLSGGIDSRTLAVALQQIKADVFSYSYEYRNGYPETKIAKQISEVCNFDFQSFKIENGYLWDKLDDLVKINQCYSDFTSPRQMAIVDKFSSMGEVFSLGHWGDVLFDNYNCKTLSHDEQAKFLSQKLLKRGGLEFATRLWKVWNLEGDFESYFLYRISSALSTINIENTNARLRAFKSKYWAPRWTSVNLPVFEKYKPIALPYYDNRICEFICTVPEEFLKNRELQIAYIKNRQPKLAELTWQDKRPYNLYNYKNPNPIRTFTFKFKNKLKRSFKEAFVGAYIQRNWELQFKGDANRTQLEMVFCNSKLGDIIPQSFISRYVSNFYNVDALNNAHAINMLLVLAKFNQTLNHG